MKILGLKLKKYRNIKKIQLVFNSEKTIIIGDNAQGKTNILESIYFLSTLKTPRTNNNQELIKIKEQKFEINAKIEKNNTPIEIDYNYNLQKNKETKINKLKTSSKEFKQVLKTVLFSTEDLLLLRGSPEDRRKWLDGAISQVYPAYEERLNKYNKIRVQKNNFLKKYDGNKDLLDVYNEQLAISGSNIIFLRKKFLKEIENLAFLKHEEISEGEKLAMYYDCGFLKDEIETAEILLKFKQKLEERKELETIRAQSLVGPHRDDVIFYINNKESTKFASQGQQRTIVLALKLAELDIITQKTGEPPVLLLDDVLAELDKKRQNFLLKAIDSNIQTIITSTDTLHFSKKFLKNVGVYKIKDGELL